MNPMKNKAMPSINIDDSNSNNEEGQSDNNTFQYFLLPLVDHDTINEISPALKKGIEYMYFLSIGAIALNLYVVYSTW